MTTFNSLFYSGERRKLYGKSNSNLYILGIIVLLVILGLSYSLKSMEELEDKMSNPFTSWVDLPILFENKAKARQLFADLRSNQSLLDSLQIKEVGVYKQFFNQFYSFGKRKYIDYLGRSNSFSDNLMVKILEPENVLVSTSDPLEYWDLCSIVITESMADDLGIEELRADDKILLAVNQLTQSQADNTNHSSFRDSKPIYLTVKAIVRELPGKSNFIISNTLAHYIHEDISLSFLKGPDNNSSFSLISRDGGLIDKQLISGMFLPDKESFSTLYPDTVYKYSLYPSSNLDDQSLLTIYQDLKAVDPSMEFFWEPNCTAAEKDLESFHSISFYLSDLNKITMLREFVKTNYDQDIDMSLVEDKKNFGMVSTMTWVSAFNLFILSLFSISLFIWFFTKQHLERSYQSLGSLMAFGLKRRDLIKLYQMLLLRMVTVVILFVYALSALTNYLFLFFTGKEYLSIFHPFLLVSLLLIILISQMIARYILNQLLLKTPGQLIYQK